jgi:hypothetical protein
MRPWWQELRHFGERRAARTRLRRRLSPRDGDRCERQQAGIRLYDGRPAGKRGPGRQLVRGHAHFAADPCGSVCVMRRPGRQKTRGVTHDPGRTRSALMPGQRHDITSFDALMAGIYCLALIGDKGFDAGWLRERLRANDLEAVNPLREGTSGYAEHDRSSSRHPIPPPDGPAPFATRHFLHTTK